MSQQGILEFIKQIVVQVNDGVHPDEIHNGASLVADLGMDSMKLASLVAEIKNHFGNVDLTEWFIAAARDGTDTVWHLAEFLHGLRRAA